MEMSCDYIPRMSIACLCSSRLLPLHTDDDDDDDDNDDDNNNNNIFWKVLM